MENLVINSNGYGEKSATFTFEGMNMVVQSGRGELFFKRVDYTLDPEKSPSRKIVSDSLINYNYVVGKFTTPWTCDAFKVSNECLQRLKASATEILHQMGYIK